MATISNIFRCKDCNAFLCTSDEITTKNGKRIPLNATGEDKYQPHKCPVNPFKKIKYDLRQLPEGRYPGEGKVERWYRGDGVRSTYDTPDDSYSHINKYEWRCTWCGEVYAYRIKAMKCCTLEED